MYELKSPLNSLLKSHSLITAFQAMNGIKFPVHTVTLIFLSLDSKVFAKTIQGVQLTIASQAVVNKLLVNSATFQVTQTQ
ncbi:MAG: hypothetical protein LBF15_01670 [Candidatus Peribacteria bacterium]|nr:hypothetical protein [Candidatus Peribacteria bacterium]